MKPSSLHSLVIDRHLGELSPEAAELLDLHLSKDATARAEADRILHALTATQDAVMHHPELAHVTPPIEKTATAPARPNRAWVPWLARAAAVALACTAGFIVGRTDSRPPDSAANSGNASPFAPDTPRKDSPWARYRMTFNPAGEGMQVVRVDTANLSTHSIQ